MFEDFDVEEIFAEAESKATWRGKNKYSWQGLRTDLKCVKSLNRNATDLLVDLEIRERRPVYNYGYQPKGGYLQCQMCNRLQSYPDSYLTKSQRIPGATTVSCHNCRSKKRGKTYLRTVSTGFRNQYTRKAPEEVSKMSTKEASRDRLHSGGNPGAKLEHES